MNIPTELVLLLARLFGQKLKDQPLKLPSYGERVRVYWQALVYTEGNAEFRRYVLGHRRTTSALVWIPAIDIWCLEKMYASSIWWEKARVRGPIF